MIDLLIAWTFSIYVSCDVTSRIALIRFNRNFILCGKLSHLHRYHCCCYCIHTFVQVLALERTWKSGNEHDLLSYIRPNPFYMGIVRMLIQQQKVMSRVVVG